MIIYEVGDSVLIILIFCLFSLADTPPDVKDTQVLEADTQGEVETQPMGKQRGFISSKESLMAHWLSSRVSNMLAYVLICNVSRLSMAIVGHKSSHPSLVVLPVPFSHLLVREKTRILTSRNYSL